jgi:hypothetical protein
MTDGPSFLLADFARFSPIILKDRRRAAACEGCEAEHGSRDKLSQIRTEDADLFRISLLRFRSRCFADGADIFRAGIFEDFLRAVNVLALMRVHSNQVVPFF